LRTEYIIRGAAAIFGGLLLCLSSFLYEDEERQFQAEAKRLQNAFRSFQDRVGNWWIKIDDKRAASLALVALFIREVSRSTGRIFDSVFGERLLSLRVVGVSFILSIASAFLSGFIASFFVHIPYQSANHGTFFQQFLRFSLLGLLPAISENSSIPWKPWFPRLVRMYWWVSIFWIIFEMGSFLLFVFASKLGGPATALHYGVILASVFGLSMLFDIFFLSMTRRTLRNASQTDRVVRILLWICLEIIVLAALLALPIYVSLKISRFALTGAVALILSIFLNSLNVAVALAALVVAFLLLIHWGMWQLFERPLYRLQGFRFALKYKSVLWTSGMSLLVLATTGIPKWLTWIFEKALHVHISPS